MTSTELARLHGRRAQAVQHHDEAVTAGFPALAETIAQRIANIDQQIDAALATDDSGEVSADTAVEVTA